MVDGMIMRSVTNREQAIFIYPVPPQTNKSMDEFDPEMVIRRITKCFLLLPPRVPAHLCSQSNLQFVRCPVRTIGSPFFFPHYQTYQRHETMNRGSQAAGSMDAKFMRWCKIGC